MLKIPYLYTLSVLFRFYVFYVMRMATFLLLFSFPFFIAQQIYISWRFCIEDYKSHIS